MKQIFSIIMVVAMASLTHQQAYSAAVKNDQAKQAAVDIEKLNAQLWKAYDNIYLALHTVRTEYYQRHGTIEGGLYPYNDPRVVTEIQQFLKTADSALAQGATNAVKILNRALFDNISEIVNFLLDKMSFTQDEIANTEKHPLGVYLYHHPEFKEIWEKYKKSQPQISNSSSAYNPGKSNK